MLSPSTGFTEFAPLVQPRVVNAVVSGPRPDAESQSNNEGSANATRSESESEEVTTSERRIHLADSTPAGQGSGHCSCASCESQAGQEHLQPVRAFLMREPELPFPLPGDTVDSIGGIRIPGLVDAVGNLPHFATRPAIAQAPYIRLEKKGLTPQPTQRQFRGLVQQVHADQLAANLAAAGLDEIASKISNCHTEWTFRRCGGCGRSESFLNRCDLSICPHCQPGLSRKRADDIKWWADQVQQPKHVVLTVRNLPTLEAKDVDGFRQNITRLRRSKFAGEWRGGLYSFEVTNCGNGWHLHAHLLVDTDWIDKAGLIDNWARIIGQSTAIVHVSDCRGEDYLREVTKYAVKGSELASWKPDQLKAYIKAIEGKRLFGTFGSLYKRRAERSKLLDSISEHNAECECGACNWTYFSENQWRWFEETGQFPQRRPYLPRGPDE